MRRRPGTSLKSYWFFAFLVFLVAAPATYGQDSADRGLPALFDARERIARPDLGTLARLRFLTTVDFPPFNFIDQSGRLAGFHVDLAREICGVLEIEAICQIQAVRFADLLPGLEKGEGDAVIAGVAITSELRERFTFSRPFMVLPARFALRTTPGGSVATPTGRVGIVSGTAHEAMLKAFFPAIKPVAFPTRAELLSALKEGRVPAVFSDAMQLSFWIAGSDAAGCCGLADGAYVSPRFLGEGLSIMTRPDDAALAQAIDHALLTLSRSGRLGEIYLRYFPNGMF